MTTDIHRTIDAVWRIESPRLIAGLARMVRDVGLAEELAQDALVSALERWPQSGVPDNPGAWLMATAKHRAIDTLRRHKLADRKFEQLGHEIELHQEGGDAAFIESLDDDIGDDLLRLVFTSCHPVLSKEARVALTLRLLGGLTTDEIARAFLVPEATVAQRIVRAKKTLAAANVPFEVPRGEELVERLAAVLEVIYLIFNEGYSATAGDDWMRPALCEDALRLGRVLAGLMQAADRSRKARGDFCDATLDRRQQSLDLVLVGDHARTCRRNFDAGSRRDRGLDHRARGCIVVMRVVAPGVHRRWRCVTASGEQGEQKKKDRGVRFHRRFSAASADVRAAGNIGWPVRRWISISARCASTATSSCWRNSAMRADCTCAHSR